MKYTIVTILSINSRETACFIKDKLETEGVMCFLTGESFDQTKGNTSELRSIKVKTEDTEKAVKILLDLHQKYDLDKIKKKDCLEGRKILVPIDLSDNSIDVCKYAVALAKRINAEIKILHVYKNPMENVNTKYTTSREEHAKLVAEQTFQKAQRKLLRFTKKIEKLISPEDFEKVKFHYSLQKGQPLFVIKAISENYKPHLILLGTRGQHDKKNIFIGSITARIIEQAVFPILTVPESASLPGNQLKIMYATNFEEADNESLNQLLQITKPFENEIHCIHFDAESNPLKQEKINLLNQKLKKNYPNENIQYDLFENNNLLKGFEVFIKQQHIDMISFSSPKRSLMYKIFNSNKLKKMLAASKTPMLIFRV